MDRNSAATCVIDAVGPNQERKPEPQNVSPSPLPPPHENSTDWYLKGHGNIN